MYTCVTNLHLFPQHATSSAAARHCRSLTQRNHTQLFAPHPRTNCRLKISGMLKIWKEEMRVYLLLAKCFSSSVRRLPVERKAYMIHVQRPVVSRNVRTIAWIARSCHICKMYGLCRRQETRASIKSEKRAHRATPLTV